MMQARIAQLEAAIDRVEPAVPLPPPAHDFDAYAAAELEARQAVSADALPSCAFLTFVNTAQALNCAAFSPDGGTVAGMQLFLVCVPVGQVLGHS